MCIGLAIYDNYQTFPLQIFYITFKIYHSIACIRFIRSFVHDLAVRDLVLCPGLCLLMGVARASLMKHLEFCFPDQLDDLPKLEKKTKKVGQALVKGVLGCVSEVRAP